MVFSSIAFLFFFLPIAFIIYYAFSFSRIAQNIWLLLVSLLFYAWGEPVYVIIMIFSIIVNWIIGIGMGKFQESKKIKKSFLLLGCIANLGILVVFKYTGFLIGTVNTVVGRELIKDPDIRLPIGISFFTFQALSYVIDVYRKKANVQKNPFYLGLYISFFPQLIAGPIVKYSSIEKQILKRKASWDKISTGICRFLEGLLKKVLLANNLAIIADHIFELTKGGGTDVPVPAMLAWLGAIAYMMQLYYDFSSYSDMAIGLGMMFGFQFSENFRYPFVSKSIKEFMSRWHISLASWFNQYVYKPLGGGSGKNKDHMVRNLFVVWLLTGLWHGAAWTYVGWGIYFFLLILIENLIRIEKIEGHNVIRHIYVIVAVIIAMVIFRCESLPQLLVYFSDLFGVSGNGFYSPTAVMFLKEYGIILIAAVLFALPLRNYVEERLEGHPKKKVIKSTYHVCYMVSISVLFVYAVSIMAKGGYNPFIYFNF